MATLTLVIPDETLGLAEARAVELGTTVNGMVCDYLAGLVWGEGPARVAMRRILSEAAEVPAGAEGSGYTWNRDELYEDRLGKWGE